MKKLKIKLDGKTFWFNDVEGYLKYLSFDGSVVNVVYQGKNNEVYSFICYGDFYGSYVEVRKYSFGIDCKQIYLDVTEDEALKFIFIDID